MVADELRKAAAEQATRAVAAALVSEHRFSLPPEWRATIQETLAHHIVVVDESGIAPPPWTDPDASTLRIDPASIPDPPEEDPNRVKRKG